MQKSCSIHSNYCKSSSSSLQKNNAFPALFFSNLSYVTCNSLHPLTQFLIPQFCIINTEILFWKESYLAIDYIHYGTSNNSNCTWWDANPDHEYDVMHLNFGKLVKTIKWQARNRSTGILESFLKQTYW